MQSLLYRFGIADLPPWFIASALVVLVLCVVLKSVASTLYSSPVQRMLRNLKKHVSRGAAGVESALTSPYERDVSESVFWSWTLAALMYTLSALLFFYALIFVLIAFNLLEPAPVRSLPRLLLGTFVALVYVAFAKYMKVGGDKVRYKLSQTIAPKAKS